MNIALWIIAVFCGWVALAALCLLFISIADEVRYPTPAKKEIRRIYKEWNGGK